jgi:hypothetical protein
MTTGVASAAAPGPAGRYEEAIRRYAAERLPELRRSTLISRLRLLTFLPGAAAFIWGLSRGPVAPFLAVAAGLLALFSALVMWHARVEERLAWLDALALVNERAAARTRRAWTRLPPADAPPDVPLEAHPYAADLDLFGRASLFQWLGPAATALGSAHAAAWLLAPAAPDEIRARQEAAAALAPLDEWREHLAAHGVRSSGARHDQIDRFLAWAEGPPLFGSGGRLLRAAVVAITALIFLLIALSATGVTRSALWLIPVVGGLVLSFPLSHRVYSWMDRAGGGQHALSRYAHLFEHAVRAPGTGRRLSEIQQRLTAGGQQAPACMRQLNRILGFGELRRSAGIFHFPIQALTSARGSRP